MLLDQSGGSEVVWCGVDGDGGRAAGQQTVHERGYEARCEQIHRRLQRIVKARGALDAQEATALREAHEQRVWRHYGYASLVEYMELEMGYSPRVALERLRVAKAIEELPVIAEALNQGDLSFSAAKEITRIATPETEQAWVEAVSEKNVREVEDLVSGHAKGDTPEDPPDPKLRTRVLRYEVLAETAALERQVKQALEKRLGERLDPNEFLSAMFRFVLENAGQVENAEAAARSETGDGDKAEQGSTCDQARYQIAVIECRSCGRGWQDGGGTTVEMTPAALETALCDAQHVGDLDSAAVAHHAGALIIEGCASSPTIVRRAHNAFTTATRVIETGRALRELGFSKHEAKSAVEEARTHVGTTELSLEQWIKIALRYCPRPTS